MTAEGNENRDTPDVKVVLELWKKTVDVQQHFNDLELRIRNFALIVVGALLALGGYALKETVILSVFGLSLSAAGLIVWSALIPIGAFYFMDRWWYHRLLKGAVDAGIPLEVKLKDLGYPIALGAEISKSSPFIWRVWGRRIKGEDAPWYKFPKRRMHSENKMDFFYASLALAICLVGWSLINPSKIEPGPSGHAQNMIEQDNRPEN